MPLQLRKEFLHKKTVEERAAMASKLYFEERLSMREIAKRMNIGTTTVNRALRSIPGFATLKKRSRITDEIKASAIELYAQGFSVPSIAEHLGGLCPQTIRNIVRRDKPDLLREFKKGVRPKVSEDQRKVVYELYNEGNKYAYIAEKAGVSVSTAGNIIKRAPSYEKRVKDGPDVLKATTQINPDDINGTVISMYRDDYMSAEQIAAKVNLSKTQVEHLIKEYRHSLKR